MTFYTKSELEEGLKAMESLISKSEKAQMTLKEGTAQHTIITRRLKAFKMAYTMIAEKLIDGFEK